MDDLLREGIAAAKSGQRERAHELLMQVVEQDEENVLAWLWLSGVVDSLDDREMCLEKALALDPTCEPALKGLAWIRKQKGAATPASGEAMTSSQPPQETLPAEPTPARVPVSAAAAVLREDFAGRSPPSEPEPEPAPLPGPDEFEDEYQCPYCAAKTDPGDRECPTCQHKLWIRVRRRKERSSWLWVALTLQAASIIWPAFISLVTLFYAARQAGLDNFFNLAPAYLGLPSDVPPEMVSAAFEVIPRLYVFPLLLYLLFSLAVMIGLYLRWRPIFYLYLANALLVLGVAIAGIAIGLGSSREAMILSPRVGFVCSGGSLILGLLMVLLVLQLEDDFFFDEKRLLLRLDPDATNGPALLSSGYRYAKQEMWAMAAIHLRRATGHMPHQTDPYLALAATYLNLTRYDLAVKALEDARRISPNDPQVEHLATILTGRRAAKSPPVSDSPH